MIEDDYPCSDPRTGYWNCVCGGTWEEYAPPIAEHTRAERYGFEPTCTSSGQTSQVYCSVCLKVLEESQFLPMLEHEEVIDEAKAPTCTESGLTEGTHCFACNEVLTAQQEIPALGHSWGQWVETIAPNATHDGVNTRVCTACAESETEIADNNPFVDVPADRFAAAILWAAEQGITTGTGDGSTFSPENPCTRKQIVTFLYRDLAE